MLDHTLRDLDVGPWAGRRRAGQIEQIEVRSSTGRAQADGHRRGSGDVDAERCNLIDLGKRVRDLVAVAFGHAAGDDQLGALTTLVAQAQDRVDRLLAGLVDEGARVDDDDVGLVGRIDRRQAVGSETTLELVGVDLVLRAAERLEEVGLRLTHGRPSLEVGAQAPEEGIQRVVTVSAAGDMVGRRVPPLIGGNRK